MADTLWIPTVATIAIHFLPTSFGRPRHGRIPVPGSVNTKRCRYVSIVGSKRGDKRRGRVKNLGLGLGIIFVAPLHLVCALLSF